MKKLFSLAIVLIFFLCFFSCSKESSIPFKIVFYPNESGESMQDARNTFKDILSKTLDREVEIITTTDYNIALETLISGKANMAYVGAEGYIQAHNRNENIIPLVTNSGASGTLSDSLYYSFIACSSKNQEQFTNEDGIFDIETIRGKKISFVSVNSTSGFTIPAKFIMKKLGAQDMDELIKEGQYFSKVIFASSHQGSQVMLWTQEADIACFAIPQTIKVYGLSSGIENADGAIYEVQHCNDKPFSDYVGEKITILKAIPVLNAPLVINSATATKEEIEKIKTVLTSSETAANPGIFKMEGNNVKGIFPKWSDKTKLIEVSDAWYDKVRQIE